MQTQQSRWENKAHASNAKKMDEMNIDLTWLVLKELDLDVMLDLFDNELMHLWTYVAESHVWNAQLNWKMKSYKNRYLNAKNKMKWRMKRAAWGYRQRTNEFMKLKTDLQNGW